ncbi:MAG: CBS domain-containing protein [Polyangiales bacterium]
MTLAQVLRPEAPPPLILDRQQSMQEALDRMQRSRATCVVVMEDNQVAALIGEREMLYHGLILGHDPGQTQLGDMVAQLPLSATADTPLQAVVAQMHSEGTQHVAITQGGTLVAVASCCDLLRAALDHMEHDVDALIAYIHGPAARPYMAHRRTARSVRTSGIFVRQGAEDHSLHEDTQAAM